MWYPKGRFHFRVAGKEPETESRQGKHLLGAHAIELVSKAGNREVAECEVLLFAAPVDFANAAAQSLHQHQEFLRWGSLASSSTIRAAR